MAGIWSETYPHFSTQIRRIRSLSADMRTIARYIMLNLHPTGNYVSSGGFIRWAYYWKMITWIHNVSVREGVAHISHCCQIQLRNTERNTDAWQFLYYGL